MEIFDNDEAGYRAWVRDHPTGFVLVSWNPPRPNYLTIHRADCHTINPAKALHKANWTKSYIKVCAPTVSELIEWAKTQWGNNTLSAHVCGFCKRAHRL